MPPATANPHLGLDERAARDVLLVRAFELEDREGRILAVADRRRAGEAAAREAGAADGERAALALLTRRASLLRALLVERDARVAAALRVAGSGRLVPWMLVPAAFLIGCAADRFHAPRLINLLSYFLFGLLAWNLAVYAALLALALFRLPRPAGGAPRLVARAAAWLAAPGRAWMRATEGTDARVVSAALRRFLADWTRAGAPLHLARARAGLHLGALALAAGAVLSLYLRGIAFEYRVTWESTFLDARAVHGLLSLALGPAARILGEGLPGPEALQLMRREPDAAATWIHLYALTLALYVGLPRLLLAALAAGRARRLARALPLAPDDPALLHATAAARGGGMRVVVLPYATAALERPAGAEALRALAGDLWGGRAQVELKPRLGYGDDPPGGLDGGGSGGEACVVVFDLAQSPEPEVHARFVEALCAGGGSGGARPARVLALIDEAGMRAALGGGAAAEERLAQRRRAWESALAGTGAVAVPVDLARPATDPALDPALHAVLARAREALRP